MFRPCFRVSGHGLGPVEHLNVRDVSTASWVPAILPETQRPWPREPVGSRTGRSRAVQAPEAPNKKAGRGREQRGSCLFCSVVDNRVTRAAGEQRGLGGRDSGCRRRTFTRGLLSPAALGAWLGRTRSAPWIRDSLAPRRTRGKQLLWSKARVQPCT
ncbi:hypothetical protein NDU88_006574 [Pleurodeles waltl]|uniref:Uncharacterized protein n=1 Tax=Pleurodeles waltl TaxID=8319 RepID=A0AAV7LR79_PLEWA|nr:hypothetical protein NDU88_006574 [Pleurodeles waltl]